MQIDWQALWRAVRRKSAPLARNGPLIVLTFAVAIGLEILCWGYLFGTNEARSTILGIVVPQALIEAIIITSQGLLALIAAMVAAERRSDPRPEQRRLVFAAQALALVLLVPPVLKAADAFAHPQQIDAARAFATSQEASALREIVADPMADTQTKRQAARDLAQATVPPRATIDGYWFASLFFAAFLYGMNMAAASLLWRARPETPAERQRREKLEDRRERSKAKWLAAQLELEKVKLANRPAWLRGIFTRKAA